MTDHIIYSYSHNSGGLTKVGMTTTGNAKVRQSNYIANHQLVGFELAPLVFKTDAINRRELQEIERQVHAALEEAGGRFRTGRSGTQEIFAIHPKKAAAIISSITGPGYGGKVTGILMRRGLLTLGIVGGAVTLVWLSYEGWRLWERKQGRNRLSGLGHASALFQVATRAGKGAIVGVVMSQSI